MNYSELNVPEQIHKAVERMGFTEMTEVQEKAIPPMMEGKDIIAKAPTGTGKTCAFGIPLILGLDQSRNYPQAVVMAPTRELAQQITEDLQDLAHFYPDIRVVTVYGGANIQKQIEKLKKGAQIVVATPGRLQDHMNRRTVDLSHVTTVVLDEADEMLNMGFSEDLNTILAGVPEERNTLLFSATMSKEIEKIARTYLHDPKEIVVGSRNEGAENVNHIYYMVSAKDKYLALKRIVDFHPRIYAIIFCRTKVETQDIADKLIKDGYNAESLHGDLSQQQRDLTMQKFRQHLTQLLVATDVAARGLDVDDLTHVINYGMPDDIENYIHRSGRTGRAGKKGTSIAIVHTREKGKIKQVERHLGKNFQVGEMPSPEEICKKQLYKVMDQIVKTDVDEEQIAPFMQDISRYFEFVDKDELIKKIVSVEFGKFLDYYANAPEVRIETGKKSRDEERRERKERGRGGRRQTEEGYSRLFINLGKKDGFYPGEVMQFINRYVKGHVAVGHIDLQNTFSFIEVGNNDAEKVMSGLTGVNYKGREVRCNSGDEPGRQGSQSRRQFEPHGKKRDFRSNGRRDDRQPKREKQTRFTKEEWMKFLNPDFEDEGWARRRPKKNK